MEASPLRVAYDESRGGMLAPAGATVEEKMHFSMCLGLTDDLLPVVSDTSAKISPDSNMRSIGKTPSRYNRRREVVGFSGWTGYRATPEDIEEWIKEPDLGLCLQTRRVRAFDVDITDETQAKAVGDFIRQRAGELPKRMRSNSSKFLLAFILEGDYSKRIIRTSKGIIENLATGQQFVACGMHESGVRYEWEGGLPAGIPTLTADQFENLWRALEAAFAVAPSVEAKTSNRKEVLHEATRNDSVAQALIERGMVKSSERDGRLNIECPFIAVADVRSAQTHLRRQQITTRRLTMPQVPTLDHFGAAPAPLPGVRQSSAASPDLLGASADQQTRLGNAVVNAGAEAVKLAAQMQEQADQVREDDALNRLRQRVLDLTYDEKIGYAARKGRAAFDTDDAGLSLSESYTGKLQRDSDEIAAELGNDNQRRNYLTKANNIVTHFRGGVLAHMRREGEHYALTTQAGTVRIGHETALANWSDASDTGPRQEAINSVKSAIAKTGQLTGEGASETVSKMLTAESAIHLGVISDRVDALFSKSTTFRNTVFGIEYGTEEKRLLALTPSDLPAESLAQIDAAFKRRGVSNPTDSDRMQAYWRLKNGR